MVKRVKWLSKIDYFIFEFFDDHDIEVSPKVLAANIGYDAGYAGKRLRALSTSGLLQQNENDLYELSDLGREFLAGDLATDEVEALDPSEQ
ncbi:phage repressor protein [Halomarina oriensis]|uniref:Phage repressor protein n=2 Tax=Halomarina oriensis TaxID=671145 RepID=A0A6B0GN40_9EURY|nr:phage repressor protein [Halomarina oriensis]